MRRSVGLIVTCLVVVVFGVNANAATYVSCVDEDGERWWSWDLRELPEELGGDPTLQGRTSKSRQVQSFVRSNPNAAAELERLESTGITSPNWSSSPSISPGPTRGTFRGIAAGHC